MQSLKRSRRLYRAANKSLQRPDRVAGFDAGLSIRFAGHVSRKMLERYSHVRMEAKRTAMEAFATSTRMVGCDASHDANAAPATLRPV